MGCVRRAWAGDLCSSTYPTGTRSSAKLIKCKCNGGSQPEPSPFAEFELPDDVRRRDL